MPAPYLKKEGAQSAQKQEDICLFAQTNFRNQMRRFGIKTDDRRRHMYIIGKTGMGKSTMMENMMLHDIYAGHGIGLVDPHGDFAEKIIDFIPSHRTNDVIYFNPSDLAYPIGFNILEVKNEEQKHLVAAGLMGTFKKIWPDVWSSRMEYILNNTLLALLENPGSTLMGINRLMSDAKYRKKIVRNVRDPVVKAFWNVEFASYSERYAQEATSSVQNKIGQFLSTTLIRNIVAQTKSTIDVRAAMDDQKILIMNLSKGRMGEDNSRLMGGMMITKIQLSAMERVDTPEENRKDFFLYVDEFQNFATPSFANILSEARKYRLGLIMAHQYVAQLDETVADAVFGNVGSIVAFRVGAADAEALAKEFAPTYLEEDIVNLSKFTVLLKLMINGVASQPFSALTMPPIGSRTNSAEKVIRVSRERYGKKREDIEDKVLRWSGLKDEIEEDIDDEANPEARSKDSKKNEKDSENTKKLNQTEKETPSLETDQLQIFDSKESAESDMEEQKQDEDDQITPHKELSEVSKEKEQESISLSELLVGAVAADVPQMINKNSDNSKKDSDTPDVVPNISKQKNSKKKNSKEGTEEQKQSNSEEKKFVPDESALSQTDQKNSDSNDQNPEKKKKKRRRRRRKKKKSSTS